ncbi:hypothetical protein ACFTY7_40925 [Streptomyces sp. NPDC057062]
MGISELARHALVSCGEERPSVYEAEHFIVSSFRSTPDVITEHHQAAPQ